MEGKMLDKLKAVNAFSILGVVLAILSLLVAITPKVYKGFSEEPQKAEMTIGNLKISMQEYQPEKSNLDINLGYTSLALTTLAFLCCVFAFITGENKRIYIGALIVIALAMAWYFF